MTIDIDELRNGVSKFGGSYLTDIGWAALIDRIEEAESEAIEQARLNGMGSEREAALMAKMEAAEKERDNANAAAAGVALHAGAMQARLEMAEKERDALRINLDDHRALVFDLRKEVEKLRAKIAEMEKQEPVAWMDRHGTLYNSVSHVRPSDKPLYTRPGARPAPSVPDDWMQHAARMAALARKLREPYWHFESIREMRSELCTLEEAALAAAPEAKT